MNCCEAGVRPFVRSSGLSLLSVHRTSSQAESLFTYSLPFIMLLQLALRVILVPVIFVEAGRNLQMNILPRQNHATTPGTSRPPSQSLEHVPRAAENTTVNWATMPPIMPGICDTANGTFCVTYPAQLNDSFPTESCVSYGVECPIVQGVCTALNGTTYPCRTYPLDCYCNIPLQLSCTWQFSTWLEWMYTEDWLQTQCPSIQPVDFTQAPSCASSCLQDRCFSHGCITGGRNCFCSLGSFFGCEANCKPEDLDSIYRWYSHECDVMLDNATAIVNSSNANVSKTAFALAKKTTIHWYEIIACTVASISVLLLIGGWFVDPIMRQIIHRQLNPKRHWE